MKQRPLRSRISTGNCAQLVHSTGEIGTDLHTLSHQLHSSTLESLGLVPAIAALCKEFTAQQAVRVEFTSDEIPRSLPPDAPFACFVSFKKDFGT